MLSKALFKQSVRETYKAFLIFGAVLALYGVVIAGMFDPAFGENMGALMQAFPQDLLNAFGFDLSAVTLTGFLSSYLYGFLLLVLPMVYEIITANRLLARHVDRGSMAYLLASPVPRRRIALTQCLTLAGGVTLLLAIFAGLLYTVASGSYPGALDVPAFLRLNLGVWLLHMALSGICFFASAVANDTRTSLALGAGACMAFYLIRMLANMGGKLQCLKYFTLFSLFETHTLLERMAPLSFAALLLIAAACYGGGIWAFCKRSLPV